MAGRPKGLTKPDPQAMATESLPHQDFSSLRMAVNMRKELCIDTLRAAAVRFPIRGAILHSDHADRYTGAAFRQKPENCGATQSLSGVAHCYDNARMESFSTKSLPTA